MHETLKQEMLKRGITGYRLAKMTGISNSDLYTALKGDRKMFPGWRKRIAKALGMSEAVLFPEEVGDNND